jgi:hypothetical protein
MRLRTVCTAAAGAVSGLPALNRGATSAISVSAKSIPAVTPPPFMSLPPRTTRMDRDRAETLEQIVRRPMGGRALSPQKSGGAEYKRADADRSDEPRPVRLALDERDRGLVGHQGVGRRLMP